MDNTVFILLIGLFMIVMIIVYIGLAYGAHYYFCPKKLACKTEADCPEGEECIVDFTSKTGWLYAKCKNKPPF